MDLNLVGKSVDPGEHGRQVAVQGPRNRSATRRREAGSIGWSRSPATTSTGPDFSGSRVIPRCRSCRAMADSRPRLARATAVSSASRSGMVG